MRLRQSAVIVLSAVCGFALMANCVLAAAVNQPSLLTGGIATPLASSVYNDGNPENVYPISGVLDGEIGGPNKDFIFYQADYTHPDQVLVFRGLTYAPNTIRIWTNADTTNPTQVTIKSSVYDRDSFNGSQYESAIGTTVSTPVASWITDTATGNLYWDFDVSTAPANTKSLYFNFGGTNGANWGGGARIGEVQAFGTGPSISQTGNLLANRPVAASSELGGSYTKDKVTDEKNLNAGANDFVFAHDDKNQQLVVHGFNSSVGMIRVWTGDDIPPLEVTIKSSKSAWTNSSPDWNTVGDTFDNLVDTVSVANKTDWSSAGEGLGWFRDFYVSAPEGTQSLYFNFGSGNALNGINTGFARIAEIQAFAVPEPSTIVMLSLSVLGLLAYAWRKRK